MSGGLGTSGMVPPRLSLLCLVAWGPVGPGLVRTGGTWNSILNTPPSSEPKASHSALSDMDEFSKVDVHAS